MYSKREAARGRYSITGVRWAESNKRKKNRAVYELPNLKSRQRIKLNNDNDIERKVTEACQSKRKLILNPIIDWTDTDVWQYIEERRIRYNSLYDMGYSRVGCIGCPMSDTKRELEKNPKYKTLYIRAFQRYIDTHEFLSEPGTII